MKAYVVQDEDRTVVGVVTDKRNIQTGRTVGLRVLEFELNGMQKVGEFERPWVVYLKGADEDRPQVWPIKHGFPEKSGPTIFKEGIEFVVYAVHPGEALNKVCSQFHFDSWDIAVSDWEQMQ